MGERGRLGLGAALVAATVAVFVLWPGSSPRPWSFRPADPIGPTSYSHIHAGMTEAEVLAIVGLPPGDYSRPRMTTKSAVQGVGGWGLHPKNRLRANDLAPDVNDGLMRRMWWGEPYILEVVLDSNRKVVGCSLDRFMNPPSGIVPD